MLSARTTGHGPALVALHGFTHTGEQFSGLARSTGRTVIAFDLPGHGLSVDAPTDFPDVVAAVRAGIDAVGDPVALLGYSQGARIALATALADQSGLEALVLISGTPGIEDDARRRDRAAADARLADRIVASGLDPFLDEWTATGLTATTDRPDDVRDLDRSRRRANTAVGLAAAVTGYGQGAQPSYWQDLGRLEVPTLLVVGSDDARYREIARRMATAIQGAKVAVIEDAGHDPLGDQPEAVGGVVSAFLDGLG